MGSSQMMNLGFRARVLAMEILCLWPPENSWGYRRIWSGFKPTVFKSSAVRSSRSLEESKIPWISMGSLMISPTVILGFKDA